MVRQWYNELKAKISVERSAKNISSSILISTRTAVRFKHGHRSEDHSVTAWVMSLEGKGSVVLVFN
jgi:hypothetical protein